MFKLVIVDENESVLEKITSLRKGLVTSFAECSAKIGVERVGCPV